MVPRYWFTLPLSAMRLAWDAQQVVALRMMKLAQPGFASQREAQRMVSEKISAALEVHEDAARSIMSGKGHLATGRAIKAMHRKVRANKKRLSKAT